MILSEKEMAAIKDLQTQEKTMWSWKKQGEGH